MQAIFFAILLGFCAFSAQAISTLPIGSSSSSTKIDLNAADASKLINSIKGIGPKRAQAIVKYRNDHGKFKSVEELGQVKGLGRAFVKKNLSQLQTIFKIS